VYYNDHIEALQVADLVANDSLSALELLEKSLRMIATLRK
jgi:hypothetical protein